MITFIFRHVTNINLFKDMNKTYRNLHKNEQVMKTRIKYTSTVNKKCIKHEKRALHHELIVLMITEQTS